MQRTSSLPVPVSN